MIKDKMDAKAKDLRDRIKATEAERDAATGYRRSDLSRCIKALQKDLRAYQYYRGR